MDIENYALSKRYTDDSISGISGILAGKNCTIDSVTDIEGGKKITFKWIADDGTSRTTSVNIMDGAQGVSISEVDIDDNSHLIIKFSDGTITDAGFIGGGELSPEDKYKLDNLEIVPEDVMKLEIDAMFAGINLPPLDPSDDDGVADLEDIDDIFSEDDIADDSNIDDIFGGKL